MAPNKFLAKLASDLDKPDGLVVITPENLRATLDPLAVGKLWGVGPAAGAKFRRLNIRTFGELRTTPLKTLTDAFGQAGEHFHRLAQGLDKRPVVPDHRAKSISQECTFPVDIGSADQLRDVLLGQVEQVARRLRRQGLRARTVTLKLRTGDFNTRTRSITLGEPTNLTQEIWQKADQLLTGWLAGDPPPLRLLGVGTSQLGAEGGQLSLFDKPGRKKQQALDKALDQITDRFGNDAVRRGKTPGS